MAIISHLFNYDRGKWGMEALENPVAPTHIKGTIPDKKKLAIIPVGTGPFLEKNRNNCSKIFPRK
ncbi:hypothetical protein [Leptospirillum ferriphilum]|uniref:hypothetical protein n=1 Tax=Leptospirillum ferriphilum TaxID=178606 RepID=UPI00130E173C|nr:hypothetical protein [Leptospirillum ferriphilum]